MSRVKVEFGELQNVASKCDYISRSIMNLSYEFQSIVNGLDWDVRSKSNIVSRSKKVICRFDNIGNALINFQRYINYAYSNYAGLENYNNDRLEFMNLDNTNGSLQETANTSFINNNGKNTNNGCLEHNKKRINNLEEEIRDAESKLKKVVDKKIKDINLNSKEYLDEKTVNKITESMSVINGDVSDAIKNSIVSDIANIIGTQGQDNYIDGTGKVDISGLLGDINNTFINQKSEVIIDGVKYTLIYTGFNNVMFNAKNSTNVYVEIKCGNESVGEIAIGINDFNSIGYKVGKELNKLAKDTVQNAANAFTKDFVQILGYTKVSDVINYIISLGRAMEDDKFAEQYGKDHEELQEFLKNSLFKSSKKKFEEMVETALGKEMVTLIKDCSRVVSLNEEYQHSTDREAQAYELLEAVDMLRDSINNIQYL